MARAKVVGAEPATPLTLEDVTCPICLSLLLEPVTLPCRHSLCLQCFHEHVSVTSLACPLCRVRISVWVRMNSKTNTLVDVKLWKAIQKHFPAQLEARLAGKDDACAFTSTVQQRVSEPGEIREEYETFLAQQTQEARQRRKKEETESIKLIQALQEEEKQRQEEQEQERQNLALEDFMLAIQLKERDAAQMKMRQKELEEMCLQDEDLARRLERTENRSPQVLNKNKGAGGSRSATASPKGPMDLFLGQKAVSRVHQQTPSSILSSSDTNTILPESPSPLPRRKSASKRFPSIGSDSEDDESSPRRQAARGKENLMGQRQGSPTRSGEGSRGRKACQDLQLSPDIDSFCVSEGPSHARHQGGKDSRPMRDSGHVSESEEEVVMCSERPQDDTGLADSPDEDLSFLLKWDSDKESLEALLAEQKRAEAQLQQELQDRLLAQALQEELNKSKPMVLRTKGSEDEYDLRKRKQPAVPEEEQPGPSRARSSKRQATLSEVFGKRGKSV